MMALKVAARCHRIGPDLNLPIAAPRVPMATRMHIAPHDAQIFADFSQKPPFLDHFDDETRNDDAN
jgi:hypothetical protein